MLKRLVIVFIFCCSCFSLGAEQQELLKIGSVKEVMQRIFDMHLTEHEITTSIIQKSLQRYIDQFDPDRVYLLEEEVVPYLHLSQGELKNILNQYQEQNYSYYWKLNQVIQKAIVRARRLRKEIFRNQLQLFKQQHGKSVLKRDMRSFASSVTILKERIQQDFLQFLNFEKERLGSFQAKQHLSAIVNLYDKNKRIFENSYLLVNSSGTALSSTERENLFVIHILKALAGTLDAYTKVFDPDEVYEMKMHLEKGFEGIGVELQRRGDRLLILRLIPGGPAERSGEIRPNDEILLIDEEAVSPLTMEEIEELVRGEEGSTLSLVLKRTVKEEGRWIDKTLTVRLRREVIALQTDRVETSYIRFGNGIIGHVKLFEFYQNRELGISSEHDVRAAIEQLKEKSNLKGLILDLRENSGGYLTEAVKTAGLFVSNGIIVISKYSDNQMKYYRDVDGTVAYDGPLVVLVSKATASAGEIVAQALQDYGVALVVGDEKTFGKGTVQSQLINGEGIVQFKVTVGKYYTVSGKTPDKEGVHSDIVVPGVYSMSQNGNEVIVANGENRLEPHFRDPLIDIDKKIKPWYLRYYVPTLQDKKVVWRSMLPTLKKNSVHRISNNKNYQLFLKEIRGEQESDEERELSELYMDQRRGKNYGEEDLQLIETYNIVEDMILLNSKARAL